MFQLKIIWDICNSYTGEWVTFSKSFELPFVPTVGMAFRESQDCDEFQFNELYYDIKKQIFRGYVVETLFGSFVIDAIENMVILGWKEGTNEPN